MNEFISFLTQYKEVLISAFGVILTLICILCKRKPKTLDDFLLALKEVCASLPSLINLVEVPGSGSAKKLKVEESALALVSKYLGRDLTDVEKDYCIREIDTTLEAILSTPQKKK